MRQSVERGKRHKEEKSYDFPWKLNCEERAYCPFKGPHLTFDRTQVCAQDEQTPKKKTSCRSTTKPGRADSFFLKAQPGISKRRLQA